MSKYKNFVRDTYHYMEIIPMWKGLVYKSFLGRKIIVAPIPFNIIYGMIYDLLLWVRCGRLKQQEFLQEQLNLRKIRAAKQRNATIMDTHFTD